MDPVRFDVVDCLEAILSGADVVIVAVRSPCLVVCGLVCCCAEVVV